MKGRLTEVWTGRRCSGFAREKGERCRADQTRGKRKGDGGKGEHEGIRGAVRRKGTQQVENLVMDEIQESHREGCEEVGRDDAEGGRGAGRTAGPSGPKHWGWWLTPQDPFIA